MTNFKLFLTEEIAGDVFKFDENGVEFFKRVENNAISPFSAVFSKDLYRRNVKTRFFWGEWVKFLISLNVNILTFMVVQIYCSLNMHLIFVQPNRAER